MYKIFILLITFMMAGCSNLETKSSSSAAVTDLKVTSAINKNKHLLLVKFNCYRGKKYKIKYKKSSSNSWINGDWTTCNPTTGNMNYQIKPLACGTAYDVKIRRKWRTTWYDISKNTKPCFIPPQGVVKLKHQSTGKCIYGYSPESSNNTWFAHTWSCYRNPGMAFSILSNSLDFTVKLKHEESGKCLGVTSNVNGTEVLLGSCLEPFSTKFELEAVTNNVVRLKGVVKNQCLYGTNINGGKVYHWQCWNDSNMNFIIEPY